MKKSKNITAIIHPNTDSPKLFKNKFLEFLTKSHLLVIDTMYALISFLLIYYFYNHFIADGWLITKVFFAGVLFWTLAEYGLHRWLYHKIGNAAYDTGIQHLFHGIHHEYPNDKSRLVLPVIPSLIFASIFFGLFFLVMGKYAIIFTPGFLMGYSTYIAIHYVIHTTKPPKKFDFWWRFHGIHHFKQHDRAFGVTSSLWDRIFMTMPEKGRRTVDVVIKRTKEE